MPGNDTYQIWNSPEFCGGEGEPQWIRGGLSGDPTCRSDIFVVNLNGRYTGVYFPSFSFVCLKSLIISIFTETYVKASTETPKHQEATIMGMGNFGPRRTGAQSRPGVDAGLCCPSESPTAPPLGRLADCCAARGGRRVSRSGWSSNWGKDRGDGRRETESWVQQMRERRGPC